MKRLKYVLTIMSTSFMLVVLLNAISMSLEYTGEWASLSVRSIFQIFVTCLFIAVVITYAESITILREHFAITSYVIMMTSVFIIEFLFHKQFELWNVIAEATSLTIVFGGVWFAIYCVHGCEAQRINQIIKENRKRNLK